MVGTMQEERIALVLLRYATGHGEVKEYEANNA